MRYLFCATCSRPTVVAEKRPEHCLSCDSRVQWRDTADTPETKYELTEGDCQLLRSFRIALT